MSEQPGENDGNESQTPGIDDADLPEDLQPGEDNPLAEPLEPGEAPEVDLNEKSPLLRASARGGGRRRVGRGLTGRPPSVGR